MTFKTVNEVPKIVKQREVHDLKSMLKEFAEGNKKCVKVVLLDDEYKSPFIAYKSITNAAKRHKLPVKVCWRKGEIYLKQV